MSTQKCLVYHEHTNTNIQLTEFFSFFFLSLSPTEAPPPAGVMVIPEEPAPSEGIVKGGYPVDMAAQSTVDLTSVGQTDLGSSEAFIESGMEPTGATPMEMGFTVLGPPESHSQSQDFQPCITEVIQPMEMAELVDILPTLSLIEEEATSGPVIPSVLDMLESFGLGMPDSDTLIQLEEPDLSSEATCLSPFQSNCSSRDTDTQASASSAGYATVNSAVNSTVNCTVNAMGHESLHSSFEGLQEVTEDEQASNIRLPGRNKVEWHRLSASSS